MNISQQVQLRKKQMAAKVLFNIYQNVFMAEKENVSINAVTVHNAIYQLLNLSYIDKIIIDNKVYGILYSNLLMEALKLHKIGKNTLSKAIVELKEADLIECVNPHTAPAYRFTDKTNTYFTNLKTNDGETQSPIKAKRKPSLFSLGKKTKYENTNAAYKKLLKEKAAEESTKFQLNHIETFSRFLDHHVSKGTAFANWFSAYRNWCRNAVSFEQKSKDKKNDTGMYG